MVQHTTKYYYEVRIHYHLNQEDKQREGLRKQVTSQDKWMFVNVTRSQGKIVNESSFQNAAAILEESPMFKIFPDFDPSLLWAT
jgi:hypothetical protein